MSENTIKIYVEGFEFSEATAQLRFVRRYVYSETSVKTQHILQQMWSIRGADGEGKRIDRNEWRDVPVEEET